MGNRVSPWGGVGPVGPATRGLVGSLVLCSVGAAIWQRAGGPDPMLWAFHAAAVRQGELWRLATYAFSCLSTMGLLLSCLSLYMLGGFHERRWGSAVFLRFWALTTVGGAALALLLQPLLNALLPMADLGVASGPIAAFDAMLVALAINTPDVRVLWGFVLPIAARQLVWMGLGLELIGGLMSGTVGDLSVRIGGALMGWLLCTGRWRPSRWRRRRRRGVAPSHLRAVPQRNRWLN